MLESALIRGVALDVEEAKVTLDEVPDRGIAASIFKAVAAEGIRRHDRAEHLARRADRPELHDPPCRRAPRERRAREHRGRRRRPVRDDAIAKLSLVGPGSKQPGVAADMFDALAAEGINIEMISTSSIRISCVIRAEDGERAVRAVHAGLDGATLDEEA